MDMGDKREIAGDKREICAFCQEISTNTLRLTLYYGLPHPGVEILLACLSCATRCQRGGYRDGYSVVFGRHPDKQIDEKLELGDSSRELSLDSPAKENILNRRETRLMVGLAPRKRIKVRHPAITIDEITGLAEDTFLRLMQVL